MHVHDREYTTVQDPHARPRLPATHQRMHNAFAQNSTTARTTASFLKLRSTGHVQTCMLKLHLNVRITQNRNTHPLTTIVTYRQMTVPSPCYTGEMAHQTANISSFRQHAIALARDTFITQARCLRESEYLYLGRPSANAHADDMHPTTHRYAIELNNATPCKLST